MIAWPCYKPTIRILFKVQFTPTVNRANFIPKTGFPDSGYEKYGSYEFNYS